MSTFISKLQKALNFRQLNTQTDVPSIMELYKQNPTYDLEIFRNTIESSVIEDCEKQIVAFGILKLFAEAVLVLDRTKTKRLQLASFKTLLGLAIKKSKELQVGDLHVFTEDPEFAQLLKKQFGFTTIRGEALVLNLREKDGQK